MDNTNIFTYKIIDNFVEIGECEGILGSDYQGDFIAFPADMLYLVHVGNHVVNPSGQYLELYLNEPMLNSGELIGYKFYYR